MVKMISPMVVKIRLPLIHMFNDFSYDTIA